MDAKLDGGLQLLGLPVHRCLESAWRRVDDEALAASFRRVGAEAVEMEPPFVQPLSRTDRREVERIRIVRDEEEPRFDRFAVDGETQPVPVREENRPGPGSGEELAPASMVLAPVNDPSVHADRHVVQEQPVPGASHVDSPFAAPEGVERPDRIVAVESEIACEVVASPERHGGERRPALERDLGHLRERSVSACHAEHVRRGGPRELGGVLAGT